MVNSVTGAPSSDTLAGLYSQPTTPSGSTSSFTDQLAAALEGYLAQSGNNPNLEIDIQKTQSQDSGTSQFLVTVKNPDSAPQASAGAPAAAAASTPVASPQAQNSQNPPLDAADPTIAQMAENDAYWAAQPPAVQQLRNVSDPGQRAAMAQDLSDQGYTIDRAIMVWGWDPMKTMAARQMYGYTWVPSYNQPSVSSPGMALPSQTPYDPGNPPPGSVAVNTDFANGLGITDPWA
jgi:hypothetical protein